MRLSRTALHEITPRLRSEMPAWPDFRTGVRLPPPPPPPLPGGGSLCLVGWSESRHSRARMGRFRWKTFGRGARAQTPQTAKIAQFSLCFSETFGLPLSSSERWRLTPRRDSDVVRRSCAGILRLFERQRQNRIDRDILSVKWTLATPLMRSPLFLLLRGGVEKWRGSGVSGASVDALSGLPLNLSGG